MDLDDQVLIKSNQNNNGENIMLWSRSSILSWGCVAACVGILGSSQIASANPQDVTFVRTTPIANPGTSSSYNLVVTLHRQGGGPAGQCIINWNDPDDSCTIEDVPDTTNALVTVYHRTSTSGGQHSVIGKMSFWISVFDNAGVKVYIPTGNVRFKTNKTGSELASLGNVAIAMLPQANVEMGETLSDRPNSGTSYFGQVMGNCGSSVNLLKSDGPGCPITMLAGCYSPVFARPYSGSNKAKIWVNRGDSVGADQVLCIEEDAEVEYVIKVE